MKLSRWLWLGTILVLSGCASVTEMSGSQKLNSADNELVKKEQSVFDEVYERSHKRATGLQKIFVKPLDMSSTEIKEIYRQQRGLHENWELTEEDIVTF